MVRPLLLFLAAITLLTGSVVNAELVHRYSFSSNVEDSVGDADGTLVVQAAGMYYVDGTLVLGNNGTTLSNGAVNYVDLPNGIISSLGSAMTMEIWCTWYGPTSGTSQRVFAFGLSDIGENLSSSALYSDFMILMPERFTHRSNISSGESSPNHIFFSSLLPTAQLMHLVVTWDDTKGTTSLYKDGILVGSCPTKFRLSEFNDVNNWLGRDIWLGAGFNGSYNEFRIYNNAFTDEMVMASYLAGQNPATVAKTHVLPVCVSPADGQASIETDITLSWQPDQNSDIVSQNIYFGSDLQQVMRATTSTSEVFMGTVTATTSNFELPQELDNGKAYYWRIEEVTSTGYCYSGPLWSYNSLEKPLPCLTNDLSGNCRVDIADLALLCQNWLASIDCTGYDCPDLTQNGLVNLEDFVAMSENWNEESDPHVVINEIHYHTDNNKEFVEFIELYHAGVAPVDLGGWTISDAIDYTFPAGTVINPNSYIVVCQNPDAFLAKFGVVAYGPFEGKLSNEGETVTLRNADDNKIDQVTYSGEFPWPVAANGEGASMELVNPYLDNDLAGSWRSSGMHYDLPSRAYLAPTPGARNRSFSFNIAPLVRQVNHSPEQPLASQQTVITAKITDADGVGNVTLKYQVVLPGAYIPAYLPVPISDLLSDPLKIQPLNPDFEAPANWLSLTMTDDGTGMDVEANDNIYTAVIPAQINRTLVRYRIVANDVPGNQVQVPYFDDESLNFAYYVYNGVPDYIATDTSVEGGAGYVHKADKLTNIPVYSLITRASDIAMCNGISSSDRINQGSTSFAVQETGRRYNWEGALVYDGKVYDHIGYRLRGGNGRYNYDLGGKRSMKLRFNRGNYFQARDIYGEKFPSKWQNLNTSKMLGNQVTFANYRYYPYGMNELIDMKLFNQAGVPAPEAWWFHFRVVDGVEETPATAGGQYAGDFYGLYLGFENYDGAFLDRQGLPEGNLYKLADKVFDGLEQLRYQGPYSVDDAADYTNIRYNLNYNSTANFIQEYLDCDEWYRYHTVVEAVRHYDIFSGSDCVHCMKNCAWYFLPVFNAQNRYGKLWYLPFDLDDTWGSYFNQGVDHGKAAIYDQSYLDYLTQYTIQPEKNILKINYRNYIREFRDLHWQESVINGMIDELAKVIEDIVPADRDRWRYDTTGGGGSIDNGLLTDRVTMMKQFAWSPGSFGGNFYWVGSNSNLDTLSDVEDASYLPAKPTITYTGSTGYPENDLQFNASAFSDPQGAGTFGAMKWRIAEYDLCYNTGQNANSNTLVSRESTWKYFKGTKEPSATIGAWRALNFSDSEWLTGQTSIGFADNDDNTILSDMYRRYSTVYLRKKFNISYASGYTSLNLNVRVDDGCIIWINGKEVARLYCSAGEKYYNSTTGSTGHEATVFDTIVLDNPSSFLVDGENIIAVHALQQGSNSNNDFSIDVELTSDVVNPIFYPSKNVKYEIDPVFESGEITTYSSSYRFPAEGIKAGRTYRVRCKMKDNTGRWSHWSAPIEFVAGEAIGSDIKNYFRLTELMYNNGEADYIEFKNTSDSVTLDLSNVSIENGVTFSFAGSAVTSLAPGGFVLVVRDKTAFASMYGSGFNSRIAGKFSGKLDNAGEGIKVSDYWNGTLIEFEYNDGRGWPIAADGSGHSLVPQDFAIEDQPYGTLDYGANWRASSYIGGSPAADDPAEPAATVVINEFMAHTDFSSPSYPGYDSNDWIELYNSSTNAVTLGAGWYLSDDITSLKKWAIPASTLAGNAYVAYDEISGFHSPLSAGFGIDKAGEKLYLSYLPGIAGQNRIVDAITFAGQINNVSMGRFPDGGPFWLNFTNGSRSSSNVNPDSHLVISEIMYHPASEDAKLKYVEIYNPTGTAVNLWTTDAGSWQLEGGVDYTFPTGKTLAAGGRILVVGFDPSVVSDMANFRQSYGNGSLVANSNIFGPWSGTLSNNGDRVTLVMPQPSDDPLAPEAISLITIDQCFYNDYWPWPSECDGLGMALQRVNYSAGYSGDDPANWTAATASVGQ